MSEFDGISNHRCYGDQPCCVREKPEPPNPWPKFDGVEIHNCRGLPPGVAVCYGVPMLPKYFVRGHNDGDWETTLMQAATIGGIRRPRSARLPDDSRPPEQNVMILVVDKQWLTLSILNHQRKYPDAPLVSADFLEGVRSLP